MKTTLFSFIIFIFVSCESHFDKGKEFQIVESDKTTPFKNQAFETNESCYECHPLIYDEFKTSMHYNSTIYRDDILKAVWETHPNFKNKTQFTCAQCHLTSADNIEDFMNEGNSALPDINNATQNEGVSCASCHRIKSIEKHRHANRNIYSEDLHTYYGIGNSGTSLAHQIDNNNEMYRTGEVCLGCHSHRENVKNYVVCITDSATREKTYETCITCHMPQVNGSGTTTIMEPKHFSHNFAGAHTKQEYLQKHVIFSAEKVEGKGFEISIRNNAPHDLFLHPLRRSFVIVSIIRDNQIIHQFDTLKQERILENDQGVAGCIEATKETKNNLIKGDLTRIFSFNYPIEDNDEVEIEFGYKLVKAEFIDRLKLKNNEELKYKIFKKERVKLVLE